MKIASKVIGSVNPSTLCRSDGQLLFACGNDVIITGGENGQQLVFKFLGSEYSSYGQMCSLKTSFSI